jgi:two-component system, OmpR family, sensor histidine kinase VicK
MSEAPPTDDDPMALLGAAAHEIKNALGPLAMTLQIAERQLLAGQPIPPADMAFARDQVRRLSRLVEDLMDLTRADLGELAVRKCEVDLTTVVAETVDTFRRAHPSAPVSVELPAAAVPVSIDDARVHQVVLNLLENAARYAPEGAPISVAVSTPGPAVARVIVRDRGPGIAAAERERIFDRFARGSAAEGKGGLGLGLYLCRMIVERHGGAIGVDSTVGDGAAFWIDLPR